MNVASVLFGQTSIVEHVLLGRTDSTLHTSMNALELQAFLFAQIEPLVAASDNLADLVRFGHHALSDAVIDCREHANEGDVLGAFDCLARAIKGHRTAKSLLSAIVDLADCEVGRLAQLGVNLAVSVMGDLGCEVGEELH